MRILPALVYFVGSILIFVPAIVIHVTTQDQFGDSDLVEYNGAPTFISFIVVVILLTIYSRLRYRKSKTTWDSGVFDEKTPFTSDILLQAYIRLGALMLRQDTEDLKGKFKYLLLYFSRHFENSYTPDLSKYINAAFRKPINLKSVMPWLKVNLRSNSQRSQLLYFLAGLSAVDGSINPSEKRFLQDVAFDLDITQKDFDSIMAMYSKYEDAFHRQQNQQRQRRTSSQSRSQYQKEKAAKVLGVSVNASKDEIKKAYRSLAKIHHPDKFAGQSAAQQSIAEERFIKIQQAYESLIEG